jgi:antitoxin (DNA-binding transcriptional repressor) of toxin-antitoxin stability system
VIQGTDPHWLGGYSRDVAVSVEELALRAGAVVEEVAKSRRHTLITDHGRPVAAIVPLGEDTTFVDELAEKISHRGVFAQLAVEGQPTVDELLAERRQEADRENLD